MQRVSQTGLWTQTPPALFPPVLGLFGLGLAWRKADETMGMPSFIGDMILGAVSLLFLLGVVAYGAKLLRRPGVVLDDLRILPGRAGAAAATTAAMLLATTVVPYSTGLAVVVLLIAVLAHAVLAFLVVVVLSPMPLAQRRITPVWHLTFVGFIVAPLAAIPLGAVGASELILTLTIPAALTVWLGHAYVAGRTGTPAPLRPLLAIHLSPICLFGIVLAMLGYLGFAALFGWISVAAMIIYILRANYLTAAGFSPLWGCFTFPLAAFANLMLILGTVSTNFLFLGGLALVGSNAPRAHGHRC